MIVTEQPQMFPDPPKTQLMIAEEFLGHFQADVESAEKSLANAQSRLCAAIVLRNDAEENLRRERMADAGVELAVVSVACRSNTDTGEVAYTGAAVPDVAMVIAALPDGTLHTTVVGQHTRYGELVAEYLTAAGIDDDIDADHWTVYGEDYGGGNLRDLKAVISSDDYGEQLIVCERPGREGTP
jgi:hypothetical protein